MTTILNQEKSNLGSIIARHRDAILTGRLRDMIGSTRRADLMKESELREQCQQLLSLLANATIQGTEIEASVYDPLREILAEISRTRAIQGFSARETATFVFSIKQPLFTAIRESLGRDSTAIAEEMWNTPVLIDGLGLYTTEAYLQAREDTIRRQSEEIIIGGVRPQIAQTMVHLGINLRDITTKASMSDAFGMPIKRSGFTFLRPSKEIN
jgi:rsbT co-antagonist protein RsbR